MNYTLHRRRAYSVFFFTDTAFSLRNHSTSSLAFVLYFHMQKCEIVHTRPAMVATLTFSIIIIIITKWQLLEKCFITFISFFSSNKSNFDALVSKKTHKSIYDLIDEEKRENKNELVFWLQNENLTCLLYEILMKRRIKITLRWYWLVNRVGWLVHISTKMRWINSKK